MLYEVITESLAMVASSRDRSRGMVATTTADALTVYRQLYDNHVSLMRFINDSSSRVPKSLAVAGEIVVNSDLKMEFERELV